MILKPDAMKMVGAFLHFRGGRIKDAVHQLPEKTVVCFENRGEQMGYQVIVLWISRFPKMQVIERPRRQFFGRLDKIYILRSNIDHDPSFKKTYQQLEIRTGEPFEQFGPVGSPEPLEPGQGFCGFHCVLAPPVDVEEMIHLLDASQGKKR